MSQCPSQECMKFHEDIRVIQAKDKIRDERDDEFVKTMKEFREFLQSLDRKQAQTEIKIKTNCNNIKEIKEVDLRSIRNWQWRIAGGTILALLTMLAHFLKKVL